MEARFSAQVKFFLCRIEFPVSVKTRCFKNKVTTRTMNNTKNSGKIYKNNQVKKCAKNT